MLQPEPSASRRQWAGWVLALVHVAVALALLALSGWFIAAAALAGAWGLASQFNYVVPSTLIRLLAFVRILSGYGERYVGHLGLLRRLGEVREHLFRRLVIDLGTTPSAEALERIEEDADALASRWVRIWHPLGSLCMVLVVFGVVFGLWQRSVFLVWVIFGLAVAGVMGLALFKGRRQALVNLAAETDLRSQWLDWSRSAPIWTLMADRGAPDRPLSAWYRWRNAHLAEETGMQRLDHGLQVLGWLAVLAAGVVVYRVAPDVRGQAFLLVPVLIWLAARDWLSGAARALPELSRLPVRRARVDALLAGSDFQAKAKPLPPRPGNTPVELSFEGYHWRRGDRHGLPVSVRLSGPGLVLLEASSGAGKSSFFEAMLGLLPEGGCWQLNGNLSEPFPAGDRRSWFHLCEQFGHVFSDTLAANLRLARPEASEEDCKAALHWAGLDDWATDPGLATWVGEPGRPLSGGEQKRLVLARAWLRDAPIWLIDEPFEGLDESLQEHLAAQLQALSRQRLLIVASHRVPAGLNPDACIRQ